MKLFIYADNAATTKLDTGAFEAMKPFLLNEYGNASQPYSFSRSAKIALKESREKIAKCINADPEEVYFTSGGTESDNWAIKGTYNKNSDRNEIITSSIEHHAVLNSCKYMEEYGCHVTYLPVDTNGCVSTTTLNESITSKTSLISIMYANNEIGTIQAIQALCNTAHKSGVLFHTDAVQAIGHVNVNVKELGIDMLSASAHKFNGPKGIGFLYIKKGTSINAFCNGGSQEFGMRAGTENIASIVGMAVALEKNCYNLTSNDKYIREIEANLLSELKKASIDFIRNGTDQIPGNISLSFKDIEGETLLHRLDLMGIAVSTGSACDGEKTQVSHVLKAINCPTDYAKGTIRLSLGKNNSIDDASTIVRAIRKIINV